jgi:sugar-specific transcriptional regulator TrmB
MLTELTRFGLTSYESRAYLALLRRDSLTAAQTAQLAGVPRQRIYDVLASLVRKGLASSRPGRVVKYAAAPPDLALERLLANHREQVADLERSAKAMVEELTAAYTAGQQHTDPLEYIEVLRDARAINERFAELQSAVKEEILVFTKPPYARPAQENVEGLELARADKARSVYERSVVEDEPFFEGVRRFIAEGEEARFVPELPLKLVIIDETIVMFGMEDPVAGTSELTIVVVEHPSLARLLKVAFEAIWSQGVTLEELEGGARQQAASG